MPAARPACFSFVLLPHFSLLAFTSAADVLVTTNLMSGSPRMRIRTLALQGREVISDIGMVLQTDGSLDSVDEELPDYLLVCGGYRCQVDPPSALARLLQRADQADVALGGLWNGVLTLAAADVMHDHQCALHPDDHESAEARFPYLQLTARSVVIDRLRISAAGPNSSLDLMLQLVQRLEGLDTMQAVRNVLRADTSLPSGADDVLGIDEERRLPAPLQKAVALMRNHIDEPLGRAQLAHQLGLSVRGVERLFRKHLKVSPARFYLELRLNRARQMLLSGSDSIQGIALDCGFSSPAHFSRCFTERFGQPPSRLRRDSDT